MDDAATVGVIACRAVGLALLISGLCTIALPAVFEYRSGWTTYSPLPEIERPSFGTRVLMAVRHYLPWLLQIICGALLLICSRSVGTLLAR
jgi:hypothetical protein